MGVSGTVHERKKRYKNFVFLNRKNKQDTLCNLICSCTRKSGLRKQNRERLSQGSMLQITLSLPKSLSTIQRTRL